VSRDEREKSGAATQPIDTAAPDRVWFARLAAGDK
jgi:hypothetical protein